MTFNNLIFVTLLLFTLYLNIKTDDEIRDEVFVFPGKAQSERDLPKCNKNEVCSIVHKRFWFPRQIERFCRCEQNECPSSWSDDDNFTMTLNNRAQMKFCESVRTVPDCGENETRYLHVENYTITDTSNGSSFETFKITSKVECYCPGIHRWVPNKHQQNGTLVSTSYRCASLPKCNANDFCGFERADHYSVYYQCSCPEGHLCVRPNKTKVQVNEVFFKGDAYRAYCTPFPPLLNPILHNE